MASRALLAARPAIRAVKAPALLPLQRRWASEVSPEIADPHMNGGYINPPPRKRALRDPYGGWWDPQERRNFGEPIHEDNDMLGVFSTEPYTHSTPGKAAFHLGVFVLSVFGLCAIVAKYYPDAPAIPRTFPGGLEAELGGSKAVLARKTEEDES